MSPTEVAHGYFARIRAGDLEGLLALFAPDAHAIFPDGKEMSGMAQLRETYATVIARGPQPQVAAIVVGEGSAAVETEVAYGDQTVRTGVFFNLGADGRITRLSIYRRG